MRVALVHDWLTGLRGGERCLLAFLKLYPNADIFTLIHVPGSTSPRIDERVRQVSFLNHLPGARRIYRFCLPLFPLAIRQFDLRGYDLVISLSHAAAKNVSVPRGTPHVCYCFTPMRYIWDQVRTYFGAKTPLLWPIVSWLRTWDRRGAQDVTQFIAISRFIAARIRRFYGRRARVIFPPVATDWVAEAGQRSPADFFLYAGALVPYKRVDVVVRVCSSLGIPLVVAGDGPEAAALQKESGPTVRWVGRVSDAELARYYTRARALIFPAKEDFGMIPIEAMAAGCPIIGLYEGALRESVIGCTPWRKGGPSPAEATGVFFQRDPQGGLEAGLATALGYFIRHETDFDGQYCQQQAGRFSVERFEAEWKRCLLEDLGRPDLLPIGGAAQSTPVNASSTVEESHA